MPTEPLVISAGATGFAWCTDRRGELRQLAVGPAAPVATVDAPPSLYPRALPTFGTEPHRRTALRVTHHDGTRSTRLAVTGVDRQVTGGGERLRITSADPDLGLVVDLVTQTWPAHDVVAQWVEISNAEPGPVTVWECASSAPLLAGPDPVWTHLGGGWAAEWTPVHERLARGSKVVESTGGVRPHLQSMPAVLFSPDGDWTEEAGSVLAAQVAWTGNTCLEAEAHPNGAVRLLCGASFRAAEVVLEPGEVLRTPEVVWAWSSEGLGSLSRRLHRWVREHRLRDGDRDRAIVANNWEATFFDFDEARLVGLVDDAADLGAELFLLDDGWFGTSHPRDDDTQGLGDWEIDRRKLPLGLDPVIEAATSRGLRFGLWFEPEMVNPGSMLADQHPEWVIGDPARPDPNLERHQLALDLLRPEVADHAVAAISRVLDEHPDISYVKWDANRALVETGSGTLAPDRQGRVLHDLVHATWAVMARVADAHPDVEMMLCASGGGRVDLGALRWFHEVWTSDNTDPLERISMQWCASWFFPASVIAAHVTRWGDRPIAFSSAVALSGRFGWDLDSATLTDDERAVLRRAAALARAIRPLVARGDVHRLEAPDGGDRAALGYVDPDGSQAVVFGYQMGDPDGAVPRLGLGSLGRCLDAEATYGVTLVLLDEPAPAGASRSWEVSGAELAAEGLAWPLDAALRAAIWQIGR